MLKHHEKIYLEATDVCFPISTNLSHSRCNAIHIRDINMSPDKALNTRVERYEIFNPRNFMFE